MPETHAQKFHGVLGLFIFLSELLLQGNSSVGELSFNAFAPSRSVFDVDSGFEMPATQVRSACRFWFLPEFKTEKRLEVPILAIRNCSRCFWFFMFKAQ